jgi:hypothetical protein
MRGANARIPAAVACAFVAPWLHAMQAPPTAGQPAPPAAAAPPDLADRLQRMQQDIEALRQQNAEQAQEITDLRAQNGDKWLSEQRVAQIRGIVGDVLSDSATRASLQAADATAGYDRTFFIASADGNFRLNIEGQLQIRYAFNNVPNSSLTTSGGRDRSQVQNEYGFELRRVKMNFFGHVFDPSWTYRIQWAYERDGENSGRPLAFEDVFVQKALGDGFFVRVGQWMNLFNYERVVGSRMQQFADRSLVDLYYDTSWVQGVLLGYEQERFRVFGSYNDGGGNRNIGAVLGTGNPTEWAFTGRFDWKFAGAWGQLRDMQGWVGSPFAAAVGVGVNWQRAGGNPPAGRITVGNGNLPNQVGSGTANTQVSNLSYTADANLRGNGWSAWAAFLGNWTYDGGAVARAQGVEDAVSYGTVVQGGVFLSNQLELIARYEGLWVVSDNQNPTQANPLVAQSLNIVTLGANWYFNQNALKLTLDGGWAMNPVRFTQGLYGLGITGSSWRGSQTGKGTGEAVIRCQLQLLF